MSWCHRRCGVRRGAAAYLGGVLCRPFVLHTHRLRVYVGPFVPPYAAQIAAAWGARRIEPLGEIAALGGRPPTPGIAL